MIVKDLYDYRDKLFSSSSKNLTDFEKNFLLIASGVYAFTITFIKDIIDTDKAVLLWMLFVSWILFAFSVGIMMFVFLRSAKLSQKLSKLIDDFIQANTLYTFTNPIADPDFNRIKVQVSIAHARGVSILSFLRQMAVSLFFTGALLFAIFVGTNLFDQNSKSYLKENSQGNTNVQCNELNVNNAMIKIGDTIHTK